MFSKLFRWLRGLRATLRRKDTPTFLPGTAVVFDPTLFNPDFWNNLPEADRLRYYGPLGYGQAQPKIFVFLCEIMDGRGYYDGHCVLVDLDDGKLQVMRHTSDFRPATEDEY